MIQQDMKSARLWLRDPKDLLNPLNQSGKEESVIKFPLQFSSRSGDTRRKPVEDCEEKLKQVSDKPYAILRKSSVITRSTSALVSKDSGMIAIKHQETEPLPKKLRLLEATDLTSSNHISDIDVNDNHNLPDSSSSIGTNKHLGADGQISPRALSKKGDRTESYLGGHPYDPQDPVASSKEVDIGNNVSSSTMGQLNKSPSIDNTNNGNSVQCIPSSVRTSNDISRKGDINAGDYQDILATACHAVGLDEGLMDISDLSEESQTIISSSLDTSNQLFYPHRNGYYEYKKHPFPPYPSKDVMYSSPSYYNYESRRQLELHRLALSHSYANHNTTSFRSPISHPTEGQSSQYPYSYQIYRNPSTSHPVSSTYPYPSDVHTKPVNYPNYPSNSLYYHHYRRTLPPNRQGSYPQMQQVHQYPPPKVPSNQAISPIHAISPCQPFSTESRQIYPSYKYPTEGHLLSNQNTPISKQRQSSITNDTSFKSCRFNSPTHIKYQDDPHSNFGATKEMSISTETPSCNKNVPSSNSYFPSNPTQMFVQNRLGYCQARPQHPPIRTIRPQCASPQNLHGNKVEYSPIRSPISPVNYSTSYHVQPSHNYPPSVDPHYRMVNDYNQGFSYPNNNSVKHPEQNQTKKDISMVCPQNYSSNHSTTMPVSEGKNGVANLNGQGQHGPFTIERVKQQYFSPFDTRDFKAISANVGSENGNKAYPGIQHQMMSHLTTVISNNNVKNNECSNYLQNLSPHSKSQQMEIKEMTQSQAKSTVSPCVNISNISPNNDESGCNVQPNATQSFFDNLSSNTTQDIHYKSNQKLISPKTTYSKQLQDIQLSVTLTPVTTKNSVITTFAESVCTSKASPKTNITASLFQVPRSPTKNYQACPDLPVTNLSKSYPVLRSDLETNLDSKPTKPSQLSVSNSESLPDSISVQPSALGYTTSNVLNMPTDALNLPTVITIAQSFKGNPNTQLHSTTQMPRSCSEPLSNEENFLERENKRPLSNPGQLSIGSFILNKGFASFAAEPDINNEFGKFKQKLLPVIDHLLTIPEAANLRPLRDSPDELLDHLVRLWGGFGSNSTADDPHQRMKENFLLVLRFLFKPHLLTSWGWDNAAPEQILDELLKPSEQGDFWPKASLAELCRQSSSLFPSCDSLEDDVFVQPAGFPAHTFPDDVFEYLDMEISSVSAQEPHHSFDQPESLIRNDHSSTNRTGVQSISSSGDSIFCDTIPESNHKIQEKSESSASENVQVDILNNVKRCLSDKRLKLSDSTIQTHSISVLKESIIGVNCTNQGKKITDLNSNKEKPDNCITKKLSNEISTNSLPKLTEVQIFPVNINSSKSKDFASLSNYELGNPATINKSNKSFKNNEDFFQCHSFTNIMSEHSKSEQTNIVSNLPSKDNESLDSVDLENYSSKLPENTTIHLNVSSQANDSIHVNRKEHPFDNDSNRQLIKENDKETATKEEWAELTEQLLEFKNQKTSDSGESQSDIKGNLFKDTDFTINSNMYDITIEDTKIIQQNSSTYPQNNFQTSSICSFQTPCPQNAEKTVLKLNTCNAPSSTLGNVSKGLRKDLMKGINPKKEYVKGLSPHKDYNAIFTDYVQNKIMATECPTVKPYQCNCHNFTVNSNINSNIETTPVSPTSCKNCKNSSLKMKP